VVGVSPVGAVASPPLLGDRIVIGVFVVTGVAMNASGEMPGEATWTVPDEPVLPWSPPLPEVLSPPDVSALLPPVWLAFPPLSGEAIVTGALAVAGASAAAVGETSAEPTCAPPDEPSTSWSAPPVAPDESPPEAAPVSPVCVASPPLFGDSTVTGALAVAGASAAAAGEASTEPTWAAPLEPVVS
jgi:hypothetical protein